MSAFTQLQEPTITRHSRAYRRLSPDRVLLLSAIILLTLLSWLVLMDARGHPSPGSPGPGLFMWTFLMWMVMQVAMMLPAIVPWLVVFTSVHEKAHKRLLLSALFATGYFSAWAAFGLLATFGQIELSQLGFLGHESALDTRVSGVSFLVAAVFQATPLKNSCLKHCRSPMGFFLANWKDGLRGAVRMGLHHGGYCLICCWALMSLCFALGIMNLIWMAALTILICIEKLTPWGHIVSRLSSLPLAATGILLISGYI